MKLTREDLEMMPAWVQYGTHAVHFLEWLLGDSLMEEVSGHVLIKVPQKDFLFLYISGEERYLSTKEPLNFCGLFYRSSYSLHDVQEPLRAILGIPKDIVFPSKEETERILEQEITEKVSDIIQNHWDEVLLKKKFETMQLIPALKREDVRNMAEKLYLEGRAMEEVVYRPKFTLQGQLPDRYYLLYLEQGSHVVNAMARQWICKRIPEISKQRILYGCIREEMREISGSGCLLKVRQMQESLVGLKEESVQVEICKKGKTLCIRMRASDLLGGKGRYSLAVLPPRERMQYERIFGKSAALRIEDIQRVVHSRKLLYTQQEAA